jgi:hypothetical protein
VLKCRYQRSEETVSASLDTVGEQQTGHTGSNT